MNTLYVIDAVNFLFRSYYAIGPMTNPKGESTNALFGFIRSIHKLKADFSPNFIVAVFDGPDNKKSRTDLYAAYKSHREGMPEDLLPQLERAIQWCEIAGIPHLSISGVEADDTMGSIAVWAKKQGVQVFLCSSDKDLCQLINDHIFMINTSKNNLLVDKNMVKELFGVNPEQIIDYLALVGDASDNIPGLEGFGPKTAASLLEKFETLDKILADPEQVPGEKKQQVLRSGKEIALLSRKLATIQTSVDFPQEEVFFHLKEPHREKLKEFYHDMHFMTLLKEMNLALTIDHSIAQEKVEYVLINDASQLDRLIERLKGEKEICLDTETSDIRPLHAHMVGIGFAIYAKEAWYIPLNGNIDRTIVLKKLKEFFTSPEFFGYPAFFGHNIKYDLHVLQNEGLPIPRICFDTILASYLLTPHNQRHNLDLLSLEKLQKVKISTESLLGKGKNQITMGQVPLEKVAAYCCEDTDYTVQLKRLFETELSEKNLLSVLMDIEIPLISVLTRMERRGIFVDIHKLEKMSHDLGHQIQELEHEIFKAADEIFNLNSPKQLSKILFEKMQIKPLKKTETGFSTSSDVLEELKEDYPFVRFVLKYRTMEKLRSTYVDSLPHEIHPMTHRIHCTFNQSIAATGRLSCQNPNLQNIPIRSTEGKKIREAFRPEQQDWSFISADYSQIELRLLAHLSDDSTLLKAFNEGEDIHAYTASVVFDVPLREVTHEMRQKAKAVNFGVLYGQQAFGLSQGLGIAYAEASAFIDTYFHRYPKVKDFLESCKENARKNGYVMTLTGRQRPIPEISHKNPMLRSAAERLAMNTPLQGTAADLIKIGMIQLSPVLKENEHLLLQIHDELLLEAPDTQVLKLSRQVKSIMENVMKLKVPLEVDISIGKNWGACYL